jgi:SAM-dependent methyltransferase
MRSMTNYFDEPVAARYDEDSLEMFDTAVLGPTVDFLSELAGDWPALELAVGTGRVALPLSDRGVRVSGIELSEAMVRRLRAKPGSEAIEVVLGDMTSTRVDGRFGLVYLVFNTIKNLLTQDAQVECFRNAAAHLRPGGHFVVEVTVPSLQRLPPGEVYRVFHRDDHHLGIDEFDVVTQQMWSHHETFDGSAYRRSSVPFRYVWPAELDLMARLADLTLRERWGGWDRRPFTSESTSHVSVWQLSS